MTLGRVLLELTIRAFLIAGAVVLLDGMLTRLVDVRINWTIWSLLAISLWAVMSLGMVIGLRRAERPESTR